MKPIFQFTYPDHNGYSFFSISVWEGDLDVGDEVWKSSNRLLEARYVIFGQIYYRTVMAANLDEPGGRWDEVLDRAKRLKAEWLPEFQRFEKAHKEFRKSSPTGGAAWDNILKRIVAR